MPQSQDRSKLPVVNMAPLLTGAGQRARQQVACEIEAACRTYGFFYLTGHGVGQSLLDQLDRYSMQFFALWNDQKPKYPCRVAARHGADFPRLAVS